MPNKPSATAPAKSSLGLGALAIVGATLLAYWPVRQAGFIWNDSDYVTAPDLRTAHGLWRIWFEVGATQQYYPLLHSAFWLEHRLWGDAAAGYHAVNVLWHAISACVFAFIFLRETKTRLAPALLAGLLFALHPVAVESVAWVTEQKNTLSTLFYLLAALVYLGPSAARRSAATYALALFCFVLAVLTKSVAATLPGALLVVLWWRQGSISWRRDVVPLLPWFVIGAAAGLFTGWVERAYVGAEGPAYALSELQRVWVAGRVAWFYLGKTIWPARLIFIYPRWPVGAGSVASVLPLLALLGLAAAAWAWRRRCRAPLAGWLLFLGGLFPLLGFFNIYAFVFSYVADHWQYLALFGVVALGAGAWGRALEAGGRCRWLFWLLAASVVGGFGVLTRRECALFHDPETFYRALLARNPACWMAHNNLGHLLNDTGRPAEAKQEFAAALRLRPIYPEAMSNYGLMLANEGRLAEAIDLYRQALRYGTDEPRTRNNLGIALVRSGRVAEGIAQYRRGLELNPRIAELHHNLAVALLAQGQAMAAVRESRAAVQLDGSNPFAHYDLGVALAQAGLPGNEAAAEWREALRLKPDFALAHLRMGSWLRSSGQLPAAIAEDETALRLDPTSAPAQNNLGNVLRDSGRVTAALAHYAEALRLDPNYAAAENNLGSALANLGRLNEAMIHFRRALALQPDFYSAEFNLAVSLKAAGRPAEAQVHFEAARRLQTRQPRTRP